MEITPGGILRDIPIQSHDINNISEPQLVPTALSYRHHPSDHDNHHPRKSSTGAQDQKVSSSLLYNYNTWNGFTTKSWIKSLWEKVDNLGINVDMVYGNILLPRDRDVCIMERFAEIGIRGDLLAQLNRCRKRQEAIFLSDIMTMNGRSIKAN